MKKILASLFACAALLVFSGCSSSQHQTEMVEPHEHKSMEGSKANMATPEITDSKWQMIDLMGESVTAPNKEKPYMLNLMTEGRMSAFAGCNSIAGSYVLSENNTITFGQMAMTKMMCPDISTEDTFVKMLSEVDSYEVSGESLVLKAGDETVARFVSSAVDS